jgi:hypothetical protein
MLQRARPGSLLFSHASFIACSQRLSHSTLLSVSFSCCCRWIDPPSTTVQIERRLAALGQRLRTKRILNCASSETPILRDWLSPTKRPRVESNDHTALATCRHHSITGRLPNCRRSETIPRHFSPHTRPCLRSRKHPNQVRQASQRTLLRVSYAQHAPSAADLLARDKILRWMLRDD